MNNLVADEGVAIMYCKLHNARFKLGLSIERFLLLIKQEYNVDIPRRFIDRPEVYVFLINDLPSQYRTIFRKVINDIYSNEFSRIYINTLISKSLSPQDSDALETLYSKNQTPSEKDLLDVYKFLNLDLEVIQIWFENR